MTSSNFPLNRREFLALPAAAILPPKTAFSRSGLHFPSKRNDLRLWYRQPAADWNEALPIGSGRLAAMVFGGAAVERIQINEDTIWAGEKRDRSNPEGAKNLAEVRRLLFAGKPKEAEALADRTIIAVPRRMPPYQPLGDIVLNFAGHGSTSEYVRELDIDSAISRVSYVSRGIRYTREIFASEIDRVIAIRVSSERPSSLSFSATLTRQQDSRTTTESNSRVVIAGEAVARGDR